MFVTIITVTVTINIIFIIVSINIITIVTTITIIALVIIISHRHYYHSYYQYTIIIITTNQLIKNIFSYQLWLFHFIAKNKFKKKHLTKTENKIKPRFFLTIVILTYVIFFMRPNSCPWFTGKCCKTPFVLLSVNHIRQDDNRTEKSYCVMYLHSSFWWDWAISDRPRWLFHSRRESV